MIAERTLAAAHVPPVTTSEILELWDLGEPDLRA
jgi:hypothetical protein